MLKHGGNLRQAAEEYGIPLEEWLDLSTGINPNGWPVPQIDPVSWLHLPQENDGLEQAARGYYKAPHVLPVAGSQAAIQILPQLRSPCRIGMLPLAYAEHEYNWRRHGHNVISLSVEQIEATLPELDVLLLINPNNPTGVRFDVDQLIDWHQQLVKKGGWLIVDEAFMDATPEQSLATYADKPGLIVLRSLGKFFGLAGARCGFVLAEPELLDKVKESLGPWTVSGPGREVAKQALADINWQANMRRQLDESGERLKNLLNCYSLKPEGEVSLFSWFRHPDAIAIQASLARQGIWVRYFEQAASLRFGLPANEQQWLKLEVALQTTMQELRRQERSNERVAI